GSRSAPPPARTVHQLPNTERDARESAQNTPPALRRRSHELCRALLPPADLSTIFPNLGLASGFSSIYSPNAAPDSGFVMVSLKPRHPTPTAQYVNRARAALGAQVPELQTFFSSGSVIEAALNFRLAAPIDIHLLGPEFPPP